MKYDNLPLMTDRTLQLLKMAMEEAEKRGHNGVAPEDIMLAMFHQKAAIPFDVLHEFHASYEEVLKVIQQYE